MHTLQSTYVTGRNTFYAHFCVQRINIGIVLYCIILAAAGGSVSAVTFSTGTGGTLAGELLECCGCKRFYPLCVCVCVRE